MRTNRFTPRGLVTGAAILGMLAAGAPPAQAAENLVKPFSEVDVDRAGASLVGYLQEVESKTLLRALAPGSKSKPLVVNEPSALGAFKIAPVAAEALGEIASEQTESAKELQDIDSIEISDVDVTLNQSNIISSTPSEIVVEYDVKFDRQFADLPADQSWLEVVPYEVTLDTQAGEIQDIIVKDLAYQLESEISEEPDREPGDADFDHGTPASTDTDAIDSSVTDIVEIPDSMEIPESFETQDLQPAMAQSRKLTFSQKQWAAEYAMRNWDKRPSGYPKFQNDCTNFVSQAMKAGGWREEAGWYKNPNVWWSHKLMKPQASWTWSSAEHFYRGFRASDRGTVLDSVYKLVVGDVLQYKGKQASNKDMNHTMIVTAVNNGVPLLTYHSNDTRNKPFTHSDMKKLYVWWFPVRI